MSLEKSSGINWLFRLDSLAVFMVVGMTTGAAEFLTGYYPYWGLLALFIPDIGLLGCLFNKKFGAKIYNFFNSYIVVILALSIGGFIFTAWNNWYEPASYEEAYNNIDYWSNRVKPPELLRAFFGVWFARIALNRFLGFGPKK